MESEILWESEITLTSGHIARFPQTIQGSNVSFTNEKWIAAKAAKFYDRKHQQFNQRWHGY
jgi:hypothetical protein